MKRFLILILLFSFTYNTLAEERGYFGIGAVGASNKTWGSYAGIDLLAEYKVSKHFETRASFEYLTSKVFSLTAHACPKMKMGIGEGFLDGSVHIKEYVKYGIGDFALSFSAGYRMNHINLQIGIMGHSISSSGENVWEPVNFLYRGELRLMKNSSKWNIAAGGGNYTDFEYERTWEPMYFLRGWVELSEKLGLDLRFDLKPSGAFHMNAKYWGCGARAGVRFKF